MSRDMKTDIPLEAALYSVPKKSSALARATTYVLKIGIVFGCVWSLSNWFEHGSPTSRFPSNHSSALEERSCPQVDALVPEKNLFFWTLLADELGSDDFGDRAVKWLGGAVQIETETFDDMGEVGEDPRWENRAHFHEYLQESFPTVHSNLELTKINTYGLLYTWKGYDAALKPYILAAHQDVVPVNPATVDQWAHPPYSGHFDGERIWGRGSKDDKSGLIAILSAIEVLIEQGFKPARTVVLPFGFDEEAGGHHGAQELAGFLLETYGEQSFAFMIDEGSGFMEQYGTVFATPGIAEKGSMNLNIEVATSGGHSSVPPPHTSIGILAALLVHIEENPFEVHIERGTPMHEFVQCLGAHASDLPSALRKAIKRSQRSNKAFEEIEKHLFSNAVYKSLAGTTQAIDIIHGGVKSNALPEQVSAVVNHRIATTSSGDATKAHDRDLLSEVARKYNLTYVAFGEQISEPDVPSKGRLTLTAPRVLEPAPVTPTQGDNASPYHLLSGTIKATYDSHRSLESSNLVVAPGMMTGNTDTRFYWDLTDHIYRYNHHNLGTSTNPLVGAHTVNESVALDSFLEIIRFFGTLILNADETILF
ncbi:hypothetical protein AAF712_001728 [Marasmius tenuissimus]|uniref:Peptidase M20 dimerisation domain-containing protein n=1 Tax=Marasmius tenuissimus TaxID=585030 RepID=A0ABR3AC67_9AGAR